LQQEELDVLSAIDMLSSLLVVLQEMRNDDSGFEKIIKVINIFLAITSPELRLFCVIIGSRKRITTI